MFLYHFYSPIYKCSDPITNLVSRIWSVSFMILFVDLPSPPVFRRTISVLFMFLRVYWDTCIMYLCTWRELGRLVGLGEPPGNSKHFSPIYNNRQTKSFNIQNVYSYPICNRHQTSIKICYIVTSELYPHRLHP